MLFNYKAAINVLLRFSRSASQTHIVPLVRNVFLARFLNNCQRKFEQQQSFHIYIFMMQDQLKFSYLYIITVYFLSDSFNEKIMH